ncbi:AMP-binding protein [Humitalea sp. 24SJ18S-53]|uniref:AMP-binding protein n=1 Tax=Humitalea sp. 24SJ18S-53 TaxID=3422307 RepID=UPI003D66CEEE
MATDHLAELGTALTPRAASEVICHHGADRVVTVGAFLAEVAAVAARLPAHGYAVNLCADRYLALVGFAAALLRGHPTLLGGGPGAPPAFLRMLAAHYPAAYAMTDASLPEAVLPACRVDGPLPAPGAALPPLPAIPHGRIAAIAFTSGSTGAPTAHPKPWGALVAGAEAAAARFGLRHQDGPPTSIVATVPPQHMYGFETTMMLPLRAAVAIHAGATFFPSDVLDALGLVPAPRLLITTPVHLRALLGQARPMCPPDAVISATAPLLREMAEAVERDWGAAMLEIYGATEAGSMASRRLVEDDTWLPYAGVQVLPGTALVPGIGAVALSDAVEPVGGGRFRLLGRLSDVVKLGGKRASLAELNRILGAVPGVVDSVLVPPEDIESNPSARLTAYVVAPGCAPDDILGALRGRLDPVFLPRRMVMVQRLPRDGLGKLPHQALAAIGRANSGKA